jgi:hypothetical protein
MGKLNNDISKIDIFENALILINTTGYYNDQKKKYKRRNND